MSSTVVPEKVTRRFLNIRRGMAAIQSTFEVLSYDNGKTHHVSADVTISDCSAVVCLDFNADTDNIDEYIDKVDNVLGVFNNLRSDLIRFKQRYKQP